MIEISRHIEILLLSNDCVIVPGLGGFMAHHIEARYDKADGMFVPPLRTLGFNPQLTMNDSLLAQSYVEAYDLSYPEALRRIEDEVNELKQHLENEGIYELNDIGTMTINEEGHYVFTPCEAGILTPELYGLNSFEMGRIGESRLQLGAESKEPETEPFDASANETAGEGNDANRPGKDQAIVIKMSWIRNAVAVAAALIAFILLTTPVSNSTRDNGQGQMMASMLPKDTNSGKKAVINLADTVRKTVEDTIAEVTEAKADSAAEPTRQTAEEAKPGYRIVLASYITKKNAAAFVDELHKKGYEEAEVFIRNNVTRVVYGNFSTQGKAYERLNSLKLIKGFEEAWVLKTSENG